MCREVERRPPEGFSLISQLSRLESDFSGLGMALFSAAPFLVSHLLELLCCVFSLLIRWLILLSHFTLLLDLLSFSSKTGFLFFYSQRVLVS